MIQERKPLMGAVMKKARLFRRSQSHRCGSTCVFLVQTCQALEAERSQGPPSFEQGNVRPVVSSDGVYVHGHRKRASSGSPDCCWPCVDSALFARCCHVRTASRVRPRLPSIRTRRIFEGVSTTRSTYSWPSAFSNACVKFPSVRCACE